MMIGMGGINSKEGLPSTTNMYNTEYDDDDDDDAIFAVYYSKNLLIITPWFFNDSVKESS